MTFPAVHQAVQWTTRDVVKATAAAVAIVFVLGIIVVVIISRNGNENILTDRTYAGVPFGLWVIAFQQLVFVFAAWNWSVTKYGARPRALGFVRPAGRKPYLKALLGWFLALAAIVSWALFIDAVGIDSIGPNENVNDIIDIGGSLVLSVAIVGFWGPLTEEIFFRGFVLGGLRKRFGNRGALLLSAGLFALFHIDPTIYVPIFFFGIVLGWLYMHTGSIWPSMAVHIVHNTTILLATTLAE
ncbi:MAG: CPBP family intramembrane metalloprotease [Chloroflexi bacterium]|nr:CPBP family intramembrane metalloprotease [Chloroflexota bacterium]